MRLSVVTISYNQCVFLAKAIDSVVGQQVELEYIVVDPGSLDGSRELLMQRRSEIDRIMLDPDDGPADGLKNGFAQATGDVFYFLNADDVMLPGAARQALAIFESDPDCSILLGDALRVDERGVPNRYLTSTYLSRGSYARGVGSVIQQGLFFTADAYHRSGGFNTKNSTCWDSELVMAMAANGAKVRRLRSPLGAFRVHQDSITGSGRLAVKYQEDRRRLAQTYGDSERLTIGPRDWVLNKVAGAYSTIVATVRTSAHGDREAR